MRTYKTIDREYYKYTTTPNVTIVGSPTVSDGVIGGFSDANYATVPSSFPSSNNWEIFIKFTTGNSFNSNYSDILTNGRLNGGTYSLALYTSSSNIVLALSSNGTNWNLANQTLFTASINTTYWIKITFDGTQYVASYSTDGETFTTAYTLSSSALIDTSVPTIFLGNNQGISNTYFIGSIDLNESYIKINDEMWWHGTVISEATEADYDFYEDKDVYKAVLNEGSTTYSAFNI